MVLPLIKLILSLVRLAFFAALVAVAMDFAGVLDFDIVDSTDLLDLLIAI